MWPIILALIAALLFAIAMVLQQRGAMQETGAEAMKAGFLLKLARRPVWLLGLVTDGLGYAAQAAALAIGRLIVVQPLLVASVVFALPLGAKFTQQRVGKREIIGAIAVTAGLAAFTVISNPAGGKDDARARDWLIAALQCSERSRASSSSPRVDGSQACGPPSSAPHPGCSSA